MPEHVIRRGAVYHWRRRIPAALRGPGDPPEIQVSLRTRCPRTAAGRAARLNAIFAHVAIPEGDSQGLRISADPVERLTKLASRGEPSASSGGGSVPRMLTRLLRVAVGGALDLVHDLFATPTPEPPRQESVPAAVPDASAELRPDVPLKALHAECAATKAQTDWTGKTLRDAERAEELFEELVGPRTARTTTGIDASDFQRLLTRLPAWHGRSIYTGLTADRSVALADRLETLIAAANEGDVAAVAERDRLVAKSQMAAERLVERLHAKTNNKHVGLLRAIFDYAEEHHYRPKGSNPFAGLFFSKAKLKKNQRRRREVWSDEELMQLFSSPLYRGHGSSRHEPGTIVTRDALYWAPLLAALNGLRMEEALQIEADDCIRVEGTWCLRIKASEAQRLKSEAAQRTVPLHPLLVELGFVDHVKAARSGSHRHIFPELRRSGPDDTFGHAFSKTFGAYRRRIGIADAGRDYHALRKTFNTSIQRKQRSDAGRHYLLGHEHGGVNYEHYFGGFTPPDLVPYLEDLHYVGSLRAALIDRPV